MLGLIKNIFGNSNDRFVKSLQPAVAAINALEEGMKALSDADLKKQTAKLKGRLAKGETLEDLLPEAFATVREASRRVNGERHYDVQLMGGIVLHQGKITEMKTGEGKTLVATLPAYLNALTGKGVHVVTVNDYLAQRDSQWMSGIFHALDMTCLPVTNDLSPQARRESYAADITYATNNELGFDYLRDHMAVTPEQQVQRPLHFAIVDEVDSILIDESRTPLIISGPTEDKTGLYKAVDAIMPAFNSDVDFELDEKQRSVALTDEGMDKAENELKKKGMLEADSSLYDMTNVMLVHHLNQAVRAHALFKKDVDYIIHSNQVVIIDEFTGRMMPGRRFSEGLHQALEAKESVDIKNENQTLASITFQNYFRMYDKLAGMTGTAETEAEEFTTIYNLPVVVMPTNVPVSRVDESDVIYRTIPEKNRAMVADIADCHKRGQPVLVGTTSIEKSEELSQMLKKEKIKHNVLNARYHEQEAEIIAQAGRLGAVTIATNMAGRGTDIKLGGNLELLLEGVEDKKKIKKVNTEHSDEKEAVMEAGGLRVLGTERHESRRIDNQLRGRSGRQGDVGSSVFYISLQDDLMRIFAGGLDEIMRRLDMPENERVQSRIITKAIETAQRKIEGRHFDVRKNLLKFDDVLNDQRKVIYDQREEILQAEKVDDIVHDLREETLDDVHVDCFPLGTFEEQWQTATYKEEMKRLFNLSIPLNEWLEEDSISPEDILERTQEQQKKVWSEKEKRLGDVVLRGMEKAILLQVLDSQWKDHLQRLDFLKQGIGLRGYGQKDPLNEFKREAFMLFDQLLTTIRDEAVMLLARVEVDEAELEQFNARMEAMAEAQQQNATATGGEDVMVGVGESGEAVDDARYANLDIPRNSPCPCGSGKKYKHCHGKIKVRA